MLQLETQEDILRDAAPVVKVEHVPHPVDDDEELVDYEPDDDDDVDSSLDSVCGVGYIRGGNDDDGISPPDSHTPPDFDAGIEPVQEPEPVPPDPGVDQVDENSRYQPHTGYGAGLYDVDNAFQRLNCYLMLWNVAHLWNKASRFIFNRYRHHNIVYVCRVPHYNQNVCHIHINFYI